MHGNFIQFDEIGFRLHGVGEHLTLVRAFSDSDLSPIGGQAEPRQEPSHDRISEGLVPIEFSVRRRVPPMPQLQPGQARLAGLTEHALGRTWPIPLGRSRLGRGSQCKIRMAHANLAEIHAEVVARPEHTVITALQSDAGLVLHGQSFGRLQFRFQQEKARLPEPMINWKRLTIVVLAGFILSAFVLALF